jgi:ubiquitin C-terminal hydrolase
MKLISKNIKRGRQEDAHEFLLYLLDAMENSVKQFLFSMNIQNLNFIRTEKSIQDNLISQIFGGKLKSSVICSNCKNSSDKYDNFLDLSLVISAFLHRIFQTTPNQSKRVFSSFVNLKNFQATTNIFVRNARLATIRSRNFHLKDVR